MLSLELARKLKEAGLKPECADFELFWLAEVEEIMHVGPGYEPEPEDVWLPGLGRLLAEIERRGYNYELTCGLSSSHKFIIHLFKGDYVLKRKYGNALDDVIAEALIWILKQEKQEKEAEQNG